LSTLINTVTNRRPRAHGRHKPCPTVKRVMEWDTLCATFPTIGWTDGWTPSAQHCLSLLVLPWVTLSLSDRSFLSTRKDGATLRRVTHQLSHLWEKGRIYAHQDSNYLRSRARGFVATPCRAPQLYTVLRTDSAVQREVYPG